LQTAFQVQFDLYRVIHFEEKLLGFLRPQSINGTLNFALPVQWSPVNSACTGTINRVRCRAKQDSRAAEFTGDHWTGSAKFNVPFIDWGLKNPSNFFLKVNHAVEIELDLKGSLQNPPAS